MRPIVLIDSGWYIRKFRSQDDPFERLHSIQNSHDLATCGVIMAEVGRGFKDRRILEKYQRAWAEMLRADIGFGLWEATLELAWGV